MKARLLECRCHLLLTFFQAAAIFDDVKLRYHKKKSGDAMEFKWKISKMKMSMETDKFTDLPGFWYPWHRFADGWLCKQCSNHNAIGTRLYYECLCYMQEQRHHELYVRNGFLLLFFNEVLYRDFLYYFRPMGYFIGSVLPLWTLTWTCFKILLFWNAVSEFRKLMVIILR